MNNLFEYNYVAGIQPNIRIKLVSNASYTFINLTWTVPRTNASVNLETPLGFEIYYHPDNNLNDGKHLSML